MIPQVGRVGVWSMEMRFGDAATIDEAAAELDELGYGALWLPRGLREGGASFQSQAVAPRKRAGTGPAP